MSRELDAAVGAAHELTREKPRLSSVPEKVGAPTVVSPAVRVDKSGHRVRLRNIDHALEGSIVSRKGEERYRLEPNKWTVVSDDVYTQLRDKFYKPQEFEVPNWNGDLNNPQHQNRVDSYQEYVIEFPDEVD